MSKGSWQRPRRVSREEYSNNWDAIFKTNMEQVVQDPKVEEAKGTTPGEAPALPVSASRGDTDTG